MPEIPAPPKPSAPAPWLVAMAFGALAVLAARQTASGGCGTVRPAP